MMMMMMVYSNSSSNLEKIPTIILEMKSIVLGTIVKISNSYSRVSPIRIKNSSRSLRGLRPI